MSERIRQLENALAAAHSPDPHPLLREDLLLVKVPIEFRNEADISPQASPPETHVEEKESFPTLLNAFGTLKIGADGHSRFFGQTARTEASGRFYKWTLLFINSWVLQHFLKVSQCTGE
jgi:hypothetical protein